MRRAGRTVGALAVDLPGHGWNPLKLAVLAGCWIAALPNWPLWRTLSGLPEMQSTRGLLFMFAFDGMTASLTAAILTVVAWRRTIKPAIV